MTNISLQKVCALAALFLMPLSALNFGISITFGDAFLLLAALLNFRHLRHVQGAQIWFLLAAPLAIASACNDVEADWTGIAQIVYLFGFVLPFGWLAFADLHPREIVKVLVASGIANSLVAAGQFAGLIPPLPSQQMVVYFSGHMVRVSGLANAVNELTQCLAPLIALLPLLGSKKLRAPALLVICAGMAGAMSKQAVFAVIGFAVFLMREGWKQCAAGALVVACGLLGLVLAVPELANRVSDQFIETVEYRESYADHSLNDRFTLAQTAIHSLADCMLIGYGPDGALHEMWRNDQESFVHVYPLGLAMVAGVPATFLVCCGGVSIFRQLYRKLVPEWTAFYVVFALGLACHTFVLMSWQSLPFLIVEAVLFQKQTQRVGQAASHRRAVAKGYQRGLARQSASVPFRRSPNGGSIDLASRKAA